MSTHIQMELPEGSTASIDASGTDTTVTVIVATPDGTTVSLTLGQTALDDLAHFLARGLDGEAVTL